MNVNSKRALQIFVASAFFLLSCDVSSFVAPQQIPTSNPDAVSLIVAQTAAAAATQTAALIPPTHTPTLTPLPTWTPPDTPTVTPTFIFLLASSTPTGNSVFTCDLVSQSPQDGTTFSINKSFTLTWKIQNTGTSAWLQNSTNLVFLSGTKISSNTSISLPKTVAPGNSISISINMTTPNQTGSYTTNWALEVGSQTFCNLFLKITVK